MSHTLSADQPRLASKRDLTRLCEVEDFETGSSLRTTFTFVDACNNAWYGRIPGVRKYDLNVEDIRRHLCRIPDETVYPELTSDLTVVAAGDDLSCYYIKRLKLLCLSDVDKAQLLHTGRCKCALEEFLRGRHDALLWSTLTMRSVV